MPNPLVSTDFQRLLDTRLREVSKASMFDELSKMIPTLYRVIASDSAQEEFYEVGALPDVPLFTGQVEYLSMAPGYHVKIEPSEFAAGVQAERKLLDDKKYAVLDDFAAELGRSMARVDEKYGVRPFAYAFSNTFDFMTSEENVALCSSSHTTKSGTSTASGYSNAGTSALSKTAVAAGRIAMRKFRNDVSERIEINPDMLIVPDNLYDTALEIVGSEKDPTSANNAINPQFKRFKVVPYLRLDDYDLNNWFMVDSRLMKKFLIWLNRIDAEFKTTVDFETFMVKHSVYRRSGNGFTNWRWIYGSSVS